MARGRQQKWICLDCGAAFAVQGIAPKMCCACGSARLGRAPSLELAENFAEKRVELERICHELNGAYGPAPDFSDATLSNVTRDILQKYSPETLENVRLKDDLELSCATSEWLFDGIDTIEGVVALLYTMAWAFAETRERLRMYEETRLSPLDLKDRLIAPFQNDMFAMVWGAFKNLYPDKDCEIYWEPQIRDEEDGKPVYGLTDFVDDGSVAVFVKPSLEVANAVEILAHELAHVAVGVEHDHDEVWQEAFDKIFEEYNRIGSQMFPNGEQCVMDDPDEK